jgi:hypothetical protein
MIAIENGLQQQVRVRVPARNEPGIFYRGSLCSLSQTDLLQHHPKL